MNILVACEESQAVTIELRKLGQLAFSCDLIACSGGHPEWHIMGDCIPLLNGDCSFYTMDGVKHEQLGRWDMLIAFPPCTHLAVSGARWFPEKQKDFRQQKAVAFFMHFVLANCDRIAVENPIGIMSTVYKKPTQIIQPYQFGDATKKATCLWLKGVPPLQPTNIVEPEIVEYHCKSGKVARFGVGIDVPQGPDGKKYGFNDPMTARLRSKTFPGIARAMAEQWTGETKFDKNQGV